MGRSLSWRVLGVTAVLGLLISGVFMLQVRATERSTDALDQSEKASATIAVSTELQTLLFTMETGARGLLITRGEGFFAPFNQAVHDFRGALSRLEELSRSEPHETAEVEEITAGMNSYVGDYLPGLLRRARGAPGAPDRTDLNQGTVRIDELAQAFNSLEHEERSEAEAAADAARDSASEAATLGTIGVVGSLVLLAALGLYLMRRVLVPVRRLADTADRIAEGELSARVPATRGRTELSRMGTSFNQMAESVEGGREAMVQAEKTKDEFFALVSHELRTPLTSIIGYIELLMEPDADDFPEKQRRTFLEVTSRNARRLRRLVGDLLFVARAEAGKMELERFPFDLAKVTRESVMTFVQRAQAEEIELTEEIGEVDACIGDEGRMGQAIENLISNAIKFTPPGGKIEVRLSPDGEDHACIAVSDSGTGIADTEQERLFEQFYRTDGARRGLVEGTGLGLGIVRSIVEGHKGEIDLESAEGEGTTVRIRVPVTASAEASIQPEPIVYR